MAENDAKEVYSLEYSVSSGAIADAIKRIETIRGLYLATAVAIIAAILSKQPGYAAAEIAQIQSDSYMLGGILLVPFLNSLLLIYTASLMHFILAAARYNTHKLRPALEKAVNAHVLQFDVWQSSDKRAWLFLRGAVGVLFYLLATFVSLGILISFRATGQFRCEVTLGLIFAASVVATSLSIVVGASSLLISAGFNRAHESRLLQPRFLYWSTVPVAVVLYMLLATRN